MHQKHKIKKTDKIKAVLTIKNYVNLQNFTTASMCT